MVTGQQVFDLACTLIDEISENGAIVLDNPEYYTTKAKSILTILQTELTNKPGIVDDLANPLLIDDTSALKVLPYGLASHLLMQEDVNTASYFNARYDELKSKMAKSIQPITDQYNVLNGMM